tara:strand:+ start:384 stop:581 length:198 start_codon:yes stop_codon:yes gene_type:complete
MIILNYLIIGFGFAFLLDTMHYMFKNHKAFENVPPWDWTQRILFILIWPLGLSVFLYAFIKQYFE